MKKNLKVVVFMIQKLIKKNITVMKDYNKMTKIVRNALEEAGKESLMKSIHDKDTSESTKKMIISKKLLDFLIFIDEKNSLIND
jgi:histidinol phosphatase-like enzyme